MFYKANLIESWGRGTVKITENCLAAGLPAPDFQEAFGGFEVVFYQDKYTEKHLRELGLNDRQVKAVLYVKEKKIISNRIYVKMFGISRQTATNDHSQLVKMNILVSVDKGQQGVEYLMTNKAN